MREAIGRASASSRTTHAAPRTRRKRRFGGFLLLVLIAACAWFGWRGSDFRRAVDEAMGAGISFKFHDPFDDIRNDWRAVFRAATWQDSARDLQLASDADCIFARERHLVRRLRPTRLGFGGRMQNVNELACCTFIEELTFEWCSELEDIDAIASLKNLKRLLFSDGNALHDDSIQRLRVALPNADIQRVQTSMPHIARHSPGPQTGPK